MDQLIQKNNNEFILKKFSKNTTFWMYNFFLLQSVLILPLMIFNPKWQPCVIHAIWADSHHETHIWQVAMSIMFFHRHCGWVRGRIQTSNATFCQQVAINLICTWCFHVFYFILAMIFIHHNNRHVLTTHDIFCCLSPQKVTAILSCLSVQVRIQKGTSKWRVKNGWVRLKVS